MTSSQLYNSSFYLALATSEYQLSPKFLAWLTVNLQVLQDVALATSSMDSALDVDQAAGVQLDILGQIIGVSRTTQFQPSYGVSPLLDDDTYRILLRSRVLFNHWSGKTRDLRRIWDTLFPGGVLLINDTQDMSVSFYAAAPFTSILKDLITHGEVLIRPQGVFYTITFATLPILGFDLNTSYVAGFDTGHFA